MKNKYEPAIELIRKQIEQNCYYIIMKDASCTCITGTKQEIEQRYAKIIEDTASLYKAKNILEREGVQ